MTIFLFIIALIGWSYGFWQRSKAKEFESLLELRKIDYPVVTVVNSNGFPDGLHVTMESASLPKLNKDGSIAKKRGRKPHNAKTV